MRAIDLIHDEGQSSPMAPARSTETTQSAAEVSRGAARRALNQFDQHAKPPDGSDGKRRASIRLRPSNPARRAINKLVTPAESSRLKGLQPEGPNVGCKIYRFLPS